MSRWIHSTQDTEWAALFTDYRRSAFRLEGQQVYDSESEREDLRRFLAGEPPNLDFEFMVPKIRAHVASGHTHTTVRVVVEPPTDYTRWELSVYPVFAEAGQTVGIIPISPGEWPPGVPRYDYWLFDDRDIWRMHYDDRHRFVGAELLDDPAVITNHLQWRDNALAQSVPLADYLALRNA